MIKVLIVDDSIEKITKIAELITSLENDVKIITAESVFNAIEILTSGATFDLAITDIYLPLRSGQEPLKNGGEMFLKEVYRKKRELSVPTFFIGLTQFPEYKDFFHPLWKVVEFSFTNVSWQLSLKQYIVHIQSISRTNIDETYEVLPTIFVEGNTDKAYLELALKEFHPKLFQQITIASQTNAGANWVSNQLAIWAIGKKRDLSGKLIQAIGLLDSDVAGIKAKKDLFDRIKTDTENNCFKVLQLAANCNSEILAFYKNRCKVEIEIESLFPLEIMEYADAQDWLEYRSSTFLEKPVEWREYEESSVDFLLGKGLNKSQLVYLKKVKRTNKDNFCKYILSLEDKDIVFKNFKPLLEALFKGLKI